MTFKTLIAQCAINYYMSGDLKGLYEDAEEFEEDDFILLNLLTGFNFNTSDIDKSESNQMIEKFLTDWEWLIMLVYDNLQEIIAGKSSFEELILHDMLQDEDKYTNERKIQILRFLENNLE